MYCELSALFFENSFLLEMGKSEFVCANIICPGVLIPRVNAIREFRMIVNRLTVERFLKISRL